jgi:hypothetical protein
VKYTPDRADEGLSESCKRDFHEKSQSVMACVYCACPCHKVKK